MVKGNFFDKFWAVWVYIWYTLYNTLYISILRDKFFGLSIHFILSMKKYDKNYFTWMT